MTSYRLQIGLAIATAVMMLAVSSEASTIPMPRLNGYGDDEQFRLTWFTWTMAMSICVEGSIYKYGVTFRNPFVVSALANLVSCFLVDMFGSCLALVGCSIILGPLALVGYGCSTAILYTLVEYAVAIVVRRHHGERLFWNPPLFKIILIANAVSTIILAIYIIIKMP